MEKPTVATMAILARGLLPAPLVLVATRWLAL